MPATHTDRFAFTCPTCRSHIEARAPQAGSLGICPRCRGVIQIPAGMGQALNPDLNRLARTVAGMGFA